MEKAKSELFLYADLLAISCFLLSYPLPSSDHNSIFLNKGSSLLNRILLNANSSLVAGPSGRGGSRSSQWDVGGRGSEDRRVEEPHMLPVR